MKAQAIHIGKRILLKTMHTQLKLQPVLKDPLVLQRGTDKYIALFKYGVVVFWGINKADQKKFIKTIKPFIKEPVRTHVKDELSVVVAKRKEEITEEKIYVKGLSREKVGIISLILSRSVALEYFENRVEKALAEFDPIMRSFEEKGKASFTTREMLKKVGFAMNIRHLSMASLAILDSPDITWDDIELNDFYNDLSEEFEIDDRYDILKEKLETIFKNVEFILGFIEGKRSIMLEFIIVVLIVLEILIFGYEIWFM